MSELASSTKKVSIDAVIFDLDGTLIDYEGLSHEILGAPLASRGYALTWELHAQIVGTRPDSWSRAILGALEVPEAVLSPEVYVAEYHALLEDRYASIAPWPGCRELLEALVARGVPLAIATSSTRKSFAAKMRHQPFILRSMSATVTGDEVAKGKPAPDIFLKAAARLGVDPARCLVFEDSPLGIAGAQAAGMLTVALPDARMPSNAARFDALAPTFVLERLADFDEAALVDFVKRPPLAFMEEHCVRWQEAGAAAALPPPPAAAALAARRAAGE